MPPKQKQAKKGPVYKAATPLKDMIPNSVKLPPREVKLLRSPQPQPQNPDKNIPNVNQNLSLFQQWPSDQIVKAHDFGINTQLKFQDKSHQKINQFLKQELQNKDKMFTWKHLHEIQILKQKQQQSQEQQQELVPKSSVNFQLENKNQSQKSIDQKNNIITVIQTYLRQQTQQQMQKRKKQEAEKAALAAKDKKKGKKQQPKQQSPLQVSDVKMSNIKVKKHMCPSGIWIGSQLQNIKIRQLRDVYNQQPIWKKIYPQQNGVPQITKSGKYWVKLYYMAKPVKIEIDDRMPINSSIKQLFPKSEKQNEKWTMILAKAILKLIAVSNPKLNITGSGLVINCLTGLVTTNIKTNNFKDWKMLQKMMDDDHYNKKDIVMTCFSSSTSINKKLPSNFIKNKQEMKDIITLQNSTFKKKAGRRNSAAELSGLRNIDQVDLEQQKIQQTYVQSNLLGGYSYCLGDYFQNNQFNMVLSKQKSLKEQKLRNQYNQMSKVALTNKSRQQKLQHRKKKKEVKQKLLIQQKKRLQQIKRPISHYHFFKVLSDLIINCEYSNKQILLAKKCIINKLQCPPNYDMPNLEKQKQQSKIGSNTIIKFKQQAQFQAPLDDFTEIQNAKDLLPRAQEGVWVKDQDLFSIFDEFQIYFNPNIFQFKSVEQVNNKINNQFTCDQNKQILVVEKKGNPHLDQVQPNKQDLRISLLFGFAFQQSKWDTLCSPYCMIQKFDFDAYRTVANVRTLNAPLSCTYQNLSNNNHVFRIYTISKGKYTYWISSDSKYKLLSIADYLSEYEGYTSKSFVSQYPCLDKNSYSAISRIKIKHEGEQKNTVYFKIKNCPKQIEKYLTLRIVQIPNEGQYTIQQTEGVILKRQQRMHLVFEYTKAQFLPNKNYYLILQAYPTQIVPEGSLQFIMLSKVNEKITLEQTEQVQPYKVMQKYTPNKYATILKERIFCSNNVNTTLVLKIFEGQQGQPVAGGDKKASKKGGKDQSTFQIIEKQLAVKRLTHAKLFKNGKIIYYSKGHNQIIIPNIQFQKTKQNVEYYLQASFDLKQWTGAGVVSQQTMKLYWSVQVMGQDAIAFVKDTLQEQRQKQIRKSWQDKQPGRAQKAKKARQKFLLELKQEKGENLTQQQLQIVNAQRLTKKKMMQQEKKNEQKKGGKGAKKDDKKAGKDKKQQIVQQKQEQRPFPKSQHNFNKQIKQFLKNLQTSKINKIQLKEGESPKIRSQEQQSSIKQGALMARQNRAAQIVRNIQLRQVMKLKQKDKKDKLTILLEDTRSSFNNEWKRYIQWRMQDQEKDKNKQQKQKMLIDILNQDKPSISEADLTKLINQYRGIEGSNKFLADVTDMIRKNIKINNLVQKINASLQGWEVENLKNYSQQIKTDKIQGINEDVMTKLANMLQQAAKNPAIVAQKQAQIKKTKKGGKK